ncbi:amidohydrolase [Alkalihalobacillus sp. AL-G]|uniref:amidohydrolase n=1 Tax=Alkalihalobacillus sp. AL-G TaxID=2926399 RepID=UPI00272BC0CF|nr:amidohydrolase [Alkalihalobacillus sp. AL-G]WLD93968.1 amidohydrolase [Alkalihalobacillus sp. AL-G]
MKTLIKNATLYPVTSSVKSGDLLIENGKITQIAESISVQNNMNVFEATGMHLLPGFIDVHTHLGLYDEGTGWAGNDANETHEPLTPHIRAIDSIHPLDIAFNDAIKFGITTVHVMPGSANVIGGQTAVIKTHGKNVKNMLVKEKAGLKIALGENPKRIHSGRHNDSITRMGIMGMLREEFYKAKHTDNPNCLRIAPIISVLKREMPVRIHAHRADDILSAVRFADEFDLDLRIEHCTEGHLVVSELADRNLQVSVGPTLTRKSKIELKNKTWQTYRILSEHDVAVSITTDHPYVPIQYLNVCAALAVREGLPIEKAIAGITINPAKNLGIDERVGSLEVGKDADITLWNNHPFHFSALPILTMINGEIVYQKSD